MLDPNEDPVIQGRRLRAEAEKPNVTIGVIPFSVGQYTGMAGPFVHLEFSGPGDDDSIYLETGYGSHLIRDTPDETRRFLETFLELEASTERLDRSLASYLDVARAELRNYGDSTPPESI